MRRPRTGSPGSPSNGPPIPGLPFLVAGPFAVRGELQFHPLQALTGLLDRFTALGGVHVGCQVHGVTVAAGCEVLTSLGLIRADHVVVPKGTPMRSRAARASPG